MHVINGHILFGGQVLKSHPYFHQLFELAPKSHLEQWCLLPPPTLLDPSALMASSSQNQGGGRVSKPLDTSTNIWGKKEAEDKASFPPYTYSDKIGHPFKNFLEEFWENQMGSRNY